jgi:transposase
LGVKGFAYRRVKNDERDAADLADLLRMGRLPQAWIAPPEVRGLREAVRHRSKLVALRSGLKAQVHAVLAKQGVKVSVSDLFGVGGQKLLDELALDTPYQARVGSLRRLIDAFTLEIDILTKHTGAQLKAHPGFQAIQTIRGVGPVLAAIFVAEVGDVTRFTRPQQLCSWAGMTPKHRESDAKVHRGRITKQGSTLVRWAAVEAVQTLREGPIGHARVRIGQRRGANIGKVAAARKLLTLVFYGLRDGHIRCLARPA